MSGKSGAILYDRPITIIKALPKLGDNNYLDYVVMLSKKEADASRNMSPAEQRAFHASKAIEKIMADVENENISKKYKNIKDIPYEKPGDYWRVLCLQFNKYVQQIGAVSKELHYFRNKLNRCPLTLDEMKAGGINEGWRLYSVKKSIYHMLRTDFSDTGLKNLKFICKDGIFEAVYNHEGKLCDETTDAVNMGTYNYATNDAIHILFDVTPYFAHGNILGVPASLSPDSSDRFYYSLHSHDINKRMEREMGFEIAETWQRIQNDKNEIKVKEAKMARVYREKFVLEWGAELE